MGHIVGKLLYLFNMFTNKHCLLSELILMLCFTSLAAIIAIELFRIIFKLSFWAKTPDKHDGEVKKIHENSNLIVTSPVTPLSQDYWVPICILKNVCDFLEASLSMFGEWFSIELQIGAGYNTSHGQNLKEASEEHKYQDVQEYLNPSVYRVFQKTENIPF